MSLFHVLLLFVVAGCGSDETQLGEQTALSVMNLNPASVDSDSGFVTFDIESNAAWEVTVEQGEEYLTIEPVRGSGNGSVKLSYTENTGRRRAYKVKVAAGPLYEYVEFSQTGFYSDYTVLYENMGAVQVDNIMFPVYSLWMKDSELSQSDLVYRATSTEGDLRVTNGVQSTNAYEGASGGNALLFGSPAYQLFEMQGIQVGTQDKFVLTFGFCDNNGTSFTAIDPNDLPIMVYGNLDGDDVWTKLAVEPSSDDMSGWVLARTEFSIPDGADTKINLRFEAAKPNSIRIDDVRLTGGIGGGGATLGEYTEPVLTLFAAQLPDANAYSATVGLLGNYIPPADLQIVETGFQNKKSADADYADIKFDAYTAGVTQDTEVSVKVVPGVEYTFRAYAKDSEGKYYYSSTRTYTLTRGYVAPRVLNINYKTLNWFPDGVVPYENLFMMNICVTSDQTAKNTPPNTLIMQGSASNDQVGLAISFKNEITQSVPVGANIAVNLAGAKVKSAANGSLHFYDVDNDELLVGGDPYTASIPKINMTQLASGNYDWCLVDVENSRTESHTPGNMGGSGGKKIAMSILNAANAYHMYTYESASFAGAAAPTGQGTLRGIVQYVDGAFVVVPRNMDDLAAMTGFRFDPNAVKISNARLLTDWVMNGTNSLLFDYENAATTDKYSVTLTLNGAGFSSTTVTVSDVAFAAASGTVTVPMGGARPSAKGSVVIGIDMTLESGYEVQPPVADWSLNAQVMGVSYVLGSWQWGQPGGATAPASYSEMPTASTSASSDISTATLGAWNVPQPTADFQTFDDGKSIQFKNGGAKWHYDTAATPLNVSGWIFEMANTTALINSGLYILFDISVQEGGNGAQDWQAEIAVNPSGGDPAAFDWQPMGGIIQLLAPADVTKRFQREYLVPSDIAAGSSIWIRMRIAGNKKIFDNNNFAAAYYRIKTGDNPVKISVSDSSVN